MQKKQHQQHGGEGISVDHIAVVVLIVEQHPSSVRTVSMCTKHFQNSQLYVVDCIPYSLCESFFTFQEVLDEYDLHTVNYIRYRDDKGPHAALQHFLSSRLLTQYSQVLLVSPIKISDQQILTDSPCTCSSLSSKTISEISTVSVSFSSTCSPKIATIKSRKRFGWLSRPSSWKTRNAVDYGPHHG